MSNLFTNSIPTSEILDSDNFEEALKLVLKSKSWSMAKLAKIMGYTPKHLSEVVHNKSDMTLKFARKLATATGYDSIFWIRLYLETYKDY